MSYLLLRFIGLIPTIHINKNLIMMGNLIHHLGNPMKKIKLLIAIIVNNEMLHSWIYLLILLIR
jgi:hypothetical protein